jgi:hypothetical protein
VDFQWVTILFMEAKMTIEGARELSEPHLDAGFWWVTILFMEAKMTLSNIWAWIMVHLVHHYPLKKLMTRWIVLS